MKLDKELLLISNTGAADLSFSNEKPIYVSEEEFIVDKSYRIYQVHKGLLTDALTIFNHDSNQDRFTVSYAFKSRESIKHWDKYREILLDLVGSINNSKE